MRRWFLLLLLLQVLITAVSLPLIEYTLDNGDPCYQLAAAADSERCFTLSLGPARWSSAVGSCLQAGQEPVVVGDVGTHATLVEIMKTRKVDNLWLPARMDRNSWFWSGPTDKVLGTYSYWRTGHPLAPPLSDIKDCVMAITYMGFTWEDKECAFDTGFVCEAEVGSKLCSNAGSLFDEVVFVGNICLLVSNQRLSFFRSRDRCSQLGAKLLRVENEATQRALQRVASWNTTFIAGYWIGLTRTRWLWHNGDEVTVSFWEASQPSRSNADCILLKRFSAMNYFWSNWNCAASMSYVCSAERPLQSTTTNASSATTPQLPSTTMSTTTQTTTTTPTTTLKPSTKQLSSKTTTTIMSTLPTKPTVLHSSTTQSTVNIVNATYSNLHSSTKAIPLPPEDDLSSSKQSTLSTKPIVSSSISLSTKTKTTSTTPQPTTSSASTSTSPPSTLPTSTTTTTRSTTRSTTKSTTKSTSSTASPIIVGRSSTTQQATPTPTPTTTPTTTTTTTHPSTTQSHIIKSITPSVSAPSTIQASQGAPISAQPSVGAPSSIRQPTRVPPTQSSSEVASSTVDGGVAIAKGDSNNDSPTVMAVAITLSALALLCLILCGVVIYRRWKARDLPPHSTTASNNNPATSRSSKKKKQRVPTYKKNAAGNGSSRRTMSSPEKPPPPFLHPAYLEPDLDPPGDVSNGGATGGGHVIETGTGNADDNRKYLVGPEDDPYLSCGAGEEVDDDFTYPDHYQYLPEKVIDDGEFVFVDRDFEQYRASPVSTFASPSDSKGRKWGRKNIKDSSGASRGKTARPKLSNTVFVDNTPITSLPSDQTAPAFKLGKSLIKPSQMPSPPSSPHSPSPPSNPKDPHKPRYAPPQQYGSFKGALKPNRRGAEDRRDSGSRLDPPPPWYEAGGLVDERPVTDEMMASHFGMLVGSIDNYTYTWAVPYPGDRVPVTEL